MARHEGIVTCTGEDGTARVRIGPGDSGIPGAPHVNVCHCATDSSSILIETVNQAGASAGDRVSVYREGGVLIRNAAALIGAPLTGTLLGILAGAGVTEAAWKTGAAVLPAAVGTATGLLAGVLIYRRFSHENRSIITHILHKGAMSPDEGVLLECGGPAERASHPGCETCGLR